MAKILIVGCGKLGYPLAQILANDEHLITGITRSKPSKQDSSIQWILLDLTKPTMLQKIPRDYDQVIIILTPASRSPEGYKIVYQQALNGLLDHLGSAHKPKVVFVSATSVYAQSQGEWVDEQSSTAPTTYNGKSLLAAEQSVLDFSNDAVVIRFSGIYGPTRNRLLRQLEQPTEIQAIPPAYTNRIHQQDCIGVLQHVSALQRELKLPGNIILASDSDPAPKFDVMCWLANKSGLAEPIAMEAKADAVQNKRCRNNLLLSTGYQLKYPDYQYGYQEMIDDS